MKVEVEVLEHKGFKEWTRAKEKGIKITQFFGRHQFIFRRDGKEISLVELTDLSDKWWWEIHCLKGDVFKDTERFYSKQEADNKIVALLTPEDQL